MAQPIYDGRSVQTASLTALCPVVENATVSKTLLNLPHCKLVLFAMDAQQELSSHKAAYTATVHVLEGRLKMNVGGRAQTLYDGDWLLLPPDEPHDVLAELPTRFLLSLIKG